MPKSVFLVGGFSASAWLYEKVKEAIEPLGITVSRPDTHVYVLVSFNPRSVLIITFKTVTRPCLMAQSLSTLTALSGLEFLVSHTESRSTSTTTQQIPHIDQERISSGLILSTGSLFYQIVSRAFYPRCVSFRRLESFLGMTWLW